MANRSKVPVTISPSVLLVLLLGIIIVSPPLGSLRTRWNELLRPAGTWLYRMGVASSPLRPKGSEQTQDAIQLRAELSALKAENEALRRQLGFPPPPEMRLTGADVTGQSSEPFARRLLINRGGRDGVVLNAAVIADGYLVGKISRVEESFSEAQLITDPSFRMTVTVGQSMTPGLGTGSLGGLNIRRIPVTDTIKPGDEVFTSNIGGELPPGLVVGTVREVTSEDNIFHDITLETPVALESLKLVMVVLP